MQDKINQLKNFLIHQERDLTACYPSERDGRLIEIEDLKKEIAKLENEHKLISELEDVISKILTCNNNDLDDKLLSIIEQNSTVRDGYIRIFRGI